jgi:phospholipase/carboxylesterase
MIEAAKRILHRRAAHATGRLLARPVEVDQADAPKGLQQLKLDGEDVGLIYVPAGYSPARRSPLALMLHGAGGVSRHGISWLEPFADEAGLILLATDSRQSTWDVIVDDYGPDVACLDRVLEQTFERYAVEPSRVGIGGFSDGASYALSLGLTNGDLFTHVLAFSPGFIASTQQRGRPRLFISHGQQDRVLPVNMCSRRIVPQVERMGYDVLYREFDGPHTVPTEVAREAVEWFTK